LRVKVLVVDDGGKMVSPRRKSERSNVKKRTIMLAVGDRLKVIPLPSNPLEILDGCIRLSEPFIEIRRRIEKLILIDAEKRV
jgi:hypothetical protein